MELFLRRDELGKIDTPGTMFADGQMVCRMLEDPVRELPGTSVSTWKIPKKTAIPATHGTPYEVVLIDSPTFGPDTLAVKDVPGYDLIRIHSGQDEEHTDGCPLTAGALEREADDGSYRIVGGTSRPALVKLKALVVPAIKSGDRVWLHVENPDAWYAMHGIEKEAGVA